MKSFNNLNNDNSNSTNNGMTWEVTRALTFKLEQSVTEYLPRLSGLSFD